MIEKADRKTGKQAMEAGSNADKKTVRQVTEGRELMERQEGR